MTIDERIAYHEIEQRKRHDEKAKLEFELNKVNEKIIYHWAAIQNLTKKKTKNIKRG